VNFLERPICGTNIIFEKSTLNSLFASIMKEFKKKEKMKNNNENKFFII